jgi:hypothetical protein
MSRSYTSSPPWCLNGDSERALLFTFILRNIARLVGKKFETNECRVQKESSRVRIWASVQMVRQPWPIA